MDWKHVRQAGLLAPATQVGSLYALQKRVERHSYYCLRLPPSPYGESIITISLITQSLILLAVCIAMLSLRSYTKTSAAPRVALYMAAILQSVPQNGVYPPTWIIASQELPLMASSSCI